MPFGRNGVPYRPEGGGLGRFNYFQGYMIALETLLDGLDMAAEPFALCQVSGNWSLDLGSRDHATLHYAMAGEGRFSLADGREIPFTPNTLLIVPAGRGHRITAVDASPSAPEATPRCRELEPGFEEIIVGTEPGVMVACGAIRATYHGVHGLFDYLMEPIVERLDADDPIARVVPMILAEQANPQTGTRALCRALMEQCLVLLLRRQCTHGQCIVPWLAALEDPRLGSALAAIYGHPAQPHTLEGLADLAGMSRSSFAEHFSHAFGCGPMEMLRDTRLAQAARLLQASDLPIKALAHNVGYHSRSYFSRAFKDRFGLSPAEYRQTGPRDQVNAPNQRGINTV